jgi:hypothetical protein
MKRCYAVYLMLLLIGCNDPSPVTHIGPMDYSDYRKTSAVARFDPKGARTVESVCYYARDSYDSWWRISISADDLSLLCREHGALIPTVQGKANTGRPVFCEPPEPLSKLPKWWEADVNAYACVVYPVSDNRNSSGWIWLYDSEKEIALGWKWMRDR